MDKKICILAVDDSPVNLAVIEQELKDKYDVIPVNSGDRALRFIKTEKPDLILLDIQMPQMNGIETLENIRKLENGANIPVIMLTAKNDKNSVLESSKFGICDYVIKPFDSKDLNERIRRTLVNAGLIPG